MSGSSAFDWNLRCSIVNKCNLLCIKLELYNYLKSSLLLVMNLCSSLQCDVELGYQIEPYSVELVTFIKTLGFFARYTFFIIWSVSFEKEHIVITFDIFSTVFRFWENTAKGSFPPECSNPPKFLLMQCWSISHVGFFLFLLAKLYTILIKL